LPNPERPAVFLDRDGTLNEEIGYVNHPTRFQIYPWAAEAVRELNRAGFAAVVVTNQSGVARGYFDETMIDVMHQKLREEMKAGGAKLDGIYYCPHHPEGRVADYKRFCECRKPALGMIERAAAELNLDLARSFVIGDRFVDMEMAQRGGMRGVFVLTGYGRGEYEYHRDSWPHQPWRIEENVLTAVRAILAEVQG
jgi:D-glycero-D-manno-heptose 1,7-bisphosphate phosphatase